MAREVSRQLYGAWISPYMSAAAHLLFEADIAFEYCRVSPFSGENRSPEHYQRNPLGKVPSFLDSDGTLVSDSLAICRYLSRRYEQAAPFYPHNDAIACARVDELNDFLTFSVGGPFFNWFVVGKHFPIAWQLKTAKESEIFSKFSMLLVNGELQRVVEAAPFSPYLLGQTPCLADIQLFYILEHGKTFAAMLDDASFDLCLHNPSLHQFYEVMLQRDATQQVLRRREAEYEQNREEYFTQMKPGFQPMIDGMKPVLVDLFGHDV